MSIKWTWVAVRGMRRHPASWSIKFHPPVLRRVQCPNAHPFPRMGQGSALNSRQPCIQNWRLGQQMPREVLNVAPFPAWLVMPYHTYLGFCEDPTYFLACSVSTACDLLPGMPSFSTLPLKPCLKQESGPEHNLWVPELLGPNPSFATLSQMLHNFSSLTFFSCNVRMMMV